MPSRPRNFILVALASILVAQIAVAGEFDPELLIGKTYSFARKSLIQEGWVPKRHRDSQAMDWEKKVRRKFPEMDSCSVDRPVCSFSFTRHGKCLRVITWGEDMKSFTVNAVAHDPCLNDNKR